MRLILLLLDSPNRRARESTNATDGRSTTCRHPKALFARELFESTPDAGAAAGFFASEELAGAQLIDPFDFPDACRWSACRRTPTPGGRRPMRRPRRCGDHARRSSDRPGPMTPIRAPEVERRLIEAMRAHMQAHAAPPEADARLDLASPT